MATEAKGRHEFPGRPKKLENAKQRQFWLERDDANWLARESLRRSELEERQVSQSDIVRELIARERKRIERKYNDGKGDDAMKEVA